MISLPNPLEIHFYLDDEHFNPAKGTLHEYSRQLNLEKRLLPQALLWESPTGRRMKLQTTRCVSMIRSHLAAVSCRITGLEGVTRLGIVSGCRLTTAGGHGADKFDPRIGAGFAHKPLHCVEKTVERDKTVLLQKTTNSGLMYAQAVVNSYCSGLNSLAPEETDEKIEFRYEGFPVSPADIFNLDKFISTYTSIEEQPGQLAEKADAEVRRAKHDGAAAILTEHTEAISRFWSSADVRIGTVDGDESLQQGIRFNIFSLYQSAGRDGMRNIAAKGLSVEGYEGHYFWDTEIYVIPFFSYTFPDIAKNCLNTVVPYLIRRVSGPA